ncbi:undecaprenyldiphospho-muramoylpentapeptide beta-N-acetylglucosaminyltransferase [Aerosakkonemataceae cyanobacterium BLCC-F154]|uniref:UDP-N-acetylglucosamine--N-acetylmuramyl-(pentapeptide) pyrophosphoryl-undecaprenol N-acetylglucosamine transferase n=1 Tax=Floridaenema fluviatile BLCC-F154 TaxID=3153640 RepID=A0ABV4Y8W8_9CYAN
MLTEKQNFDRQAASLEGNASVPRRLLIAASGTGGHLFPALALAEQLPDYQIEWLGVPNRLEKDLIPSEYPLNTIAVEGFQERFGLGTVKIVGKFTTAIRSCRELLKRGKFNGVFTTGGYIAAPAIIAARSLGLPAILHEANAIPGKVTRFFGSWCNTVAVGFEPAAKLLPRSKTVYTSTPVRSQFLAPEKHDLAIPDDVPLIAVIGGSQGAVAVNKFVRQSAKSWFDNGAWVVHQTGENDPDVGNLQHPHYFHAPFYNNMAGLLQRADLVISRAGAGSLTELAVMGKPTILIPYPFAAEDHQTYNAKIFADAGAALVFKQSELTPEILRKQVSSLLESPDKLQRMSEAALSLAVKDSAERLAKLVRQFLE